MLGGAAVWVGGSVDDGPGVPVSVGEDPWQPATGTIAGWLFTRISQLFTTTTATTAILDCVRSRLVADSTKVWVRRSKACCPERGSV